MNMEEDVITKGGRVRINTLSRGTLCGQKYVNMWVHLCDPPGHSISNHLLFHLYVGNKLDKSGI